MSVPPRRNSVAAGLSSASFCRSANDWRNSASASAGLPICNSSTPRLLWSLARLWRNCVTAGLSSASFWSKSQRLAELGLRLR